MALALVTGGNRGLGFETSRQLVERGWQVVLAARDPEQAESAAAKLGQAATPVTLDVEQPASIEALGRSLRDGPPLDALVNNAGASFDGFDERVARRTLDINYRGPLRVTDALFALLAPGANIVMVSSGMGSLGHVTRPLRERLMSPKLGRAEVEGLANAFVERVARGEPGVDGFPDNAYSVSKVLLNAFTRILARELLFGRRRVNAVCPGWVRTRMGGSSAPRSVAQGAQTIVWAATLDDSGPSGVFFRDERPIAW
jgi:carbonyl reductase 1